MTIPVEEALRYMGAAHADGSTRRLAEETAQMLEERLHPRYLWRAFRIIREDREIHLDGAGIRLPGQLAGKMLSECDTTVLMICTLGAGFDRIMKEWEARDMARAAVMDVCGNRFPGMYCTDRFSPGYGDLPLSLQADFLRVLDAGRKLGITSNESFLLLPCKSVTAVVGLSDRPQGAKIRGCAYCALRENCAYRKGGKFCGV